MAESPPPETYPPPLIPGLPDAVGELILSAVPYADQSRLRCCCKSWRYFFTSKDLFFVPNLYLHLFSFICIFPDDPSRVSPFLFDPYTLAFCPLPLMPPNPRIDALRNFTPISIGSHLYVIGGSFFDTRVPMTRPSASASIFRFNAYEFLWEPLAPMLSNRGSFACAATPDCNHIWVAGGGSRHMMYRGRAISLAERYDVIADKWVAIDSLPQPRAGCVGFFVGNGKEESSFWVMGGYGNGISEYYSDAVVKKGSDGTWRGVGDSKRILAEKIVVIEHEDSHPEIFMIDRKESHPEIFMIDREEIIRYDMASNSWLEETKVPNISPPNFSGVVGLDGELYVLSTWRPYDWKTEQTLSVYPGRGETLYIQIYNPRNKTWRFVEAKIPVRNHDS